MFCHTTGVLVYLHSFPTRRSSDLSSVAVAAVVVAIGAASIGWSHVNDSGFWLIGRFCGFDTVTTFKTWSLVGTTISIVGRSEEHTSELQSRGHLVCRLLLEKKKKT